MSFWYDETFEDKIRFGIKSRTLLSKQSEFQKIDILDTDLFGRTLALDEKYMTSEKDEFYYHEMLVHPPMTTAKRIERALVIGGGDGGAVRELLRYPEVKKVVMVEIDGQVIEACRELLPAIGTAWNDPRLEVIVGDGVDYAKNALVEPFDVVLLDGCDPIGPAEGLFNIDFYKGCRRLLGEGGVFALQSESPVVFLETFLKILKNLKSIFKTVHPYFGPVPIYITGSWSWTYATDSAHPFIIDEKRMSRIEKTCKYYNRDIHRAAFALPTYIRKAIDQIS